MDLSNSYFAAAKPEDIGDAIVSRIQQTNLWKNNSEIRRNYVQAHVHSYASISLGQGRASIVDRDGDQGELSKVRVNRSRSVEKALLGLLMSGNITWRPTARNNDPAVRGSLLKAQRILEWLWKMRHFRNYVSRWVDQGLRYGEGWLFVPWDPFRGEASGLGSQRMGDLNPQSVVPWHVFRDDTYNDYRACPWLCARTFVSRWDAQAMWPKDVRGNETKSKIAATVKDARLINDGTTLAQGADVVPLYHFYHRKTPAMPVGRQVIFTSGQCVLEDAPLQYGAIPLLRFAPDEFDDSPYGYTPFFDILGIQEEMDGLESAIASNQLTFATQSISMVEGTSASPDDVQGLKVFYYQPGQPEPKALQLTSTPKEVFAHLDRLKEAQRDIMGLNDVAMGQPDTAQMNAQAFAILAGMAQQRNAPLQSSVVEAVSELGSLCLDTFRRHTPEPRAISITGKDALDVETLSFQGGELAPIEGVIIDIGSSLEQSVPGRFQLSQVYQEMGAIKSPDQMQQVMETGRLDPVTDPLRAEQLMMDSENAAMREGQVPPVHYCDNHILHAQMHRTVIDSVQARTAPVVVKAFHAHLDEHYANYWGLPPGTPAQADPQFPIRIRILLGQQPPPIAPPMMGGPPAPGEPPASGGAPGGPAGPPPKDKGPSPLDAPQPGRTAPGQPQGNPLGPIA